MINALKVVFIVKFQDFSDFYLRKPEYNVQPLSAFRIFDRLHSILDPLHNVFFVPNYQLPLCKTFGLKHGKMDPF